MLEIKINENFYLLTHVRYIGYELFNHVPFTHIISE